LESLLQHSIISTVNHYFHEHTSDDEKSTEENGGTNSKEKENSLLLIQVSKNKLHISQGLQHREDCIDMKGQIKVPAVDDYLIECTKWLLQTV
jgi:hypothetical protein